MLRCHCSSLLVPLVLSGLLLWAPAAAATLIDFDDRVNGEPISDQYLASEGVSITVENRGGGPDLGIAFDASLDTPTTDPDLRGPDWAGGNLADEVLDRILIIAENDIGLADDGLVDDPDDEGSRPAGVIRVAFETPVRSFGFDLIDVDSLRKENGLVRFYADGGEVGSIDFAGLAARDASIEFGDNTANRIAPLLAAEFQVEGFDRIDLELGGSGAVDNFLFERVPEPTGVLLLGLGLVGAGVGGRRRA